MSDFVSSSRKAVAVRSGGVRGQVHPSVQNRYSMAFKHHVVSEVESGRLSLTKARQRYGIGGAVTISQWIRKFGKNHLLPKVVRVETPKERDRVRTQTKRIRELESALADAHIKIMAYESLIEVAEQEYKLDLKKNCGTKRSSGSTESDHSVGDVSGKGD